MELTAIRGVGAAYSARLREAGIRDIATLASHEDLSTLAERTGIPTSKLAAFRAEAIALAAQEVRPPSVAIRGVAAALVNVIEEARSILLERFRSGRARSRSG